MRKYSFFLVFPLLLLLLLAGCSSDNRAERSAGSALWIGGGASFDKDSVTELQQAGMTDLFLYAGTLKEDVPGMIERAPLPDLPASTQVTLALTGSWDSSDAGDLASRAAEGMEQLRFDSEARGWIVSGIHLDIMDISSESAWGDFIKGLRKELDGGLFLSISLSRDVIGRTTTQELVQHVDFVVPFLYGQRVSEPEDKDAWNFQVIQEKLKILETYEVPYLVGIVSLGSATHESMDGRVKARTTRKDLSDLMLVPSLELETGFSLDAGERRIYTLKAQADTQDADWEIAGGEMVRVVRLAPKDIDNLLQVLHPADFPSSLGFLIYRLPTEEEKLAINLGNLLPLLNEQPVEPEIILHAEDLGRHRGGRLFRFEVTNLGRDFTELSLIDNNYLQITTPKKNAFGAKIETGGFYRYEYFRTLSDGSLDSMYRDANIIRLHAPVLNGEQTISTGDVEIRMSRPEFEMTARFLLTDGRTIEVGPYRWENGELIPPPGADPPSDEPASDEAASEEAAEVVDAS